MTVESMTDRNDVSTAAAKLDTLTVSSPLTEDSEMESSLPNSFETDVAQEELAEEPRSIILGMLSQVTKGMDLHRITFPTFVLEPRSMLERITDFMSHPQLLLG
jgi:hypothetical protein